MQYLKQEICRKIDNLTKEIKIATGASVLLQDNKYTTQHILKCIQQRRELHSQLV